MRTVNCPPSTQPGWRPLRQAVAAAALGLSAWMAGAQPVPELDGRTLDGQPYSIAAQRGKVQMVVFWSTACAVCRDTLPELRSNRNGWRGKPFELVLVATDGRRQDVLDYERVLERIVPMPERIPSLWRNEPGHRDGFGVLGQLPATFVIDRDGKVVARFSGRVPAEAWDRVAELLP